MDVFDQIIGSAKDALGVSTVVILMSMSLD